MSTPQNGPGAAQAARTALPATDGPERRGGATRVVRGADLQVGDILFFLSKPHRLTHFKPYDGPFDFIDRIAYSGNPDDPHCWGMSLEASARYFIA